MLLLHECLPASPALALLGLLRLLLQRSMSKFCCVQMYGTRVTQTLSKLRGQLVQWSCNDPMCGCPVMAEPCVLTELASNDRGYLSKAIFYKQLPSFEPRFCNLAHVITKNILCLRNHVQAGV